MSVRSFDDSLYSESKFRGRVAFGVGATVAVRVEGFVVGIEACSLHSESTRRCSLSSGSQALLLSESERQLIHDCVPSRSCVHSLHARSKPRSLLSGSIRRDPLYSESKRDAHYARRILSGLASEARVLHGRRVCRRVRELREVLVEAPPRASGTRRSAPARRSHTRASMIMGLCERGEGGGCVQNGPL